MNKYLWSTLAAAALASGCNSSNKSASARPPLSPLVTDISPTPPAHYPYSPQPIQPMAAQPIEQPAATASFASSGGGTYTVQKGDTLYKIARERYGDGKQWQKIAAANPGLSPQSLKVGQKISVPQ
jgi:5'-nucleotidase / UDP-sugar diphosphatase